MPRNLARLRFSGNESKSWGLPDVRSNSKVSLVGPFQMLQILLQRRIVKLGQKFDCDRRIVPPDFFDKLTFAHIRHTFKMVRLILPNLWRSIVKAPKLNGSFSDRLFGRLDLKTVSRQ